jgi:hypothetical protein
MTRLVLIVAPADDPHAHAVAIRVEQLGGDGIKPVFVDTATLSSLSRVSLEPSRLVGGELLVSRPLPGAYRATIPSSPALLTRQRISLRDVHAIWWRRPARPIPGPELTTASLREFSSFNAFEAFKGLVSSFSSSITVINEPYTERRAANKILQLQVAHSVGLKVPQTLVSNDSRRIRSFVEREWGGGREVIYKTVTLTRSAQQSTQLFDQDAICQLDSARHCPTIFQRRAAGVDVRVTVVGKRLFAFEQDPKGRDSGVDGRFDEFDCVKMEVPEDTCRKVLRMQRDLGLAFGAYDFKKGEDGELVFLEVNPTGQWLWAELQARLRIAEAVAAALIDGPNVARPLMHEPFLQDDVPEVNALEFDIGAYTRALHPKGLLQ